MQSVKAYAPANIALSKYWGKRDGQLNLPTNGSLSLSLGNLGTSTSICAAEYDAIQFNGKRIENHSPFAQKIWRFVDLFCPQRQEKLLIDTYNTIPTAAGLASSASGFAALTLALNDYYDLQLDKKKLSILARQGSGSACRSLWHGFVKWQKGSKEDGSDSFAYPLESDWKALRFAVIEISHAEKSISSTEAMNRTSCSSPLFSSWVSQAEQDLQQIEQAIVRQDFTQLGEVSEANALMMHATMIAARPSICYWKEETFSYIQQVQTIRKQGLEIYLTIDAGPNIKILYQQSDEKSLKNIYPNANYINPFRF